MISSTTIPTIALENVDWNVILQTENFKVGELTNLLIQGKDNYELLKIDGNKIYSQFHTNNQKYLIEEQISNSLNTIVSNYYNITDGNKTCLGQTKTIIKEASENSHTIQILENGSEVDYQYI